MEETNHGGGLTLGSTAAEPRTAGEQDYRIEAAGEHRERHVLLSGCSGGGKSTLLAALAGLGYATFAEPGRQVVKEQLLIDGPALPWRDLGRFVELTVSRSLHDRVAAAALGTTCFHDRGVIDQLSALERRGLRVPAHIAAAAERCRYHPLVFTVPPWRALFATDAERRHDFDEAVADHEASVAAYCRHGYTPVDVPPAPVAVRAARVLARLGLQPSSR